MAYRNDTMNGGFSGSLRAAEAVVKPAARLSAGPFDVTSAERENHAATLPDALITGLLVVYPALATAVAIVVGLFLSSPVAGA